VTVSSSVRRRFPFAMATLLFVLPAPAPGEDEPSADVFRRGGMHAALMVGYGHGFRAGSRSDRRLSRELGKVRIVQAIPRFGIGVTGPLGGDAWYRGNIEWLFEGAFLYNTEPRSGWAAGAGSTLRYNFLTHARLVPFLDANFGLIGLDFDLPGQSDGLNFNVGFGIGAHWFVRSDVSLTTELRWQHISNAGINRPNFGVNDMLLLIGVSRFFD
jgi:hypothetical protein